MSVRDRDIFCRQVFWSRIEFVLLDFNFVDVDDRAARLMTGPNPKESSETAETQETPKRRRRFPDSRLRVPCLYFAIMMALFSIQRLGVYLATRDRFEGISLSDILKSFFIGLRFDAVMACTAVLPIVLVLAPCTARAMELRWTRNFVSAYCGVTLGAVLLGMLADFFFFLAYDVRLDQKVLYYAQFGSTYRMLASDYPVIPATLATAATMTGLSWVFLRVGFASEDRLRPAVAMTWPVIALLLMALAIRGGLGSKPINTATAYFTNSVSVSQLSLNGLFTLREAAYSQFVRHQDLAQFVDLLPEDVAFTMTVEALRSPNDRFLDDPENPLRRITDAGIPRNDYNVVLVIMESMSWHYVGALGSDKRLTPNLDALWEKSISMDRCFAVGTRTPYGLSAIVSGFPDLPGDSITTRNQVEGNFLTLGGILRRRDYDTLFIHGGDANYDHMQAFLRSNGFDQTIFREQFKERTFQTHLGWCDEDLYMEAHRRFLEMGERPFLATLLTVSFHRPYEHPEGKVDPVPQDIRNWRELTSARYADYAIGRFIEVAREADYFDRTIFVFVADHTGDQAGQPISPSHYRIPFLIYAPGIFGEEGRRINTVCSQTDVSPTIMALLGGSYEHSFFGSNVIDRPIESGIAHLQRSSRALAVVDADAVAVVVPFVGGEPRLMRVVAPDDDVELDVRVPEHARRRDDLARLGTAILQTASLLYERGVYNLSDEQGSVSGRGLSGQ